MLHSKHYHDYLFERIKEEISNMDQSINSQCLLDKIIQIGIYSDKILESASANDKEKYRILKCFKELRNKFIHRDENRDINFQYKSLVKKLDDSTNQLKNNILADLKKLKDKHLSQVNFDLNSLIDLVFKVSYCSYKRLIHECQKELKNISSYRHEQDKEQKNIKQIILHFGDLLNFFPRQHEYKGNNYTNYRGLKFPCRQSQIGAKLRMLSKSTKNSLRQNTLKACNRYF